MVDLILRFAQTATVMGVVWMEWKLIVEMRETRIFLQKINDNVLGAVAANMALNTAIGALTAWMVHWQKNEDRGDDAEIQDSGRD